LLFSLRKKQHDRINAPKETMGQQEGEESRSSRAMSAYAMPRQGKDGIHPPRVWWMGNFSDAFAEVRRLTPLCCTLLHISEHHQMLA
jgi:hypothetical protein